MTDRVAASAADNQLPAILEGGPADIPDAARQRLVTGSEEKVKLAHRGGYEHFVRESEPIDPRDGVVTFRWAMRTRIAE